MMKITIPVLLAVATQLAVAEDVKVELCSPGLAPSHVNAKGDLEEDWGSIRFRLEGETLGEGGTAAVSPITLDEIIPAARIAWQQGGVAISAVAFRAPVWPAGLDVLTVKLDETGGEMTKGALVLSLPEGARIGERAVLVGSRRVMALPDRARAAQEMRQWGYFDEAQSLLDWAKPKSGFDPAFSNIRAGMGGVSILYRFVVKPRSASDVVLGFCESHWAGVGDRFMTVKVEGADTEIVDPVAQWGRHQPGGMFFEGNDANGDGWLDLLVLPGPGTPDRNPILNAIWIFEPGLETDPDQVITGRLNALAKRYVDVGGDLDQSLLPGSRLELSFALAPKGAETFTFLVACCGGSAPQPDKTTWTPEGLRKITREVLAEWPEK